MTRVLIIGVGSIGERHLRCFQQTERAELTVCETDSALRARVSAQYGVEATASVEEALSNPPDAAVICTPADSHVALATQLVDAGAHALIEKPISTSLEGIDRLRSLAESKERVLAVAYVSRLHPTLASLRDAVASQRFGKPVQLVATSGQHFPFYRPAYREIYYQDHRTGGGAVQDALTHLINTGQWLVGPITQLAADAAHQVLDGVEVEDTAHVIARHGDLLASYSLNQYQAANETSMSIVCERGMVRFESHHNRWRWVTEPETPWQDEAGEAMQRDDLFVAQAQMFLDAVEQRCSVACSLDEAEATLAACLAILKAAETRSWVTMG